ncbi:MAG: hypothetical protein UR25_C0002G0003 [Candidatus Nomurabacteria bacterium GW2011_GWE1_32_28]|uniref:Uncharacterized protein n=1 Tax=Candidatus Nomurabacteria bacterium GW2011_GWF1_31_48 TaxID=1618767 RepID=A0A0G0BHG2_9BACT|nr:MAG: hypothetical protein UR10_C0002G0003 [Candidatus Nomurabacteria bacterium GW2011_GWF2_30_133]KKP29108.1 MAG: hypothetical protein UR18_C0001G0229 [Candidatus Nomurabacteria bacterium GW2011_GWE2_31_40]KKP30482.1 MAG: hypothetical protein UR19_C0002G0003 [Candidatus Nomurabacteria bacterium GW2011_GWF1_31_48]KKP34967.1 MAG: hypothetical protein UR25_C0002G0003 [Candidatus Nomurabacteria bacterium GW2011_GWE1_32_28]HAS80665.1 hypothetical protein [Candidatus Nomurabacteria bacterium]
MKNFFKKIKLYIIIWATFFLVVVVLIFYFFEENKKIIKENTLKADVKLTESGFDKFYQKEDNEFCIEEDDKQKQEDISRDMLWTLELANQNIQKVKKIECKNGKTGIKVN